MLEQNGFGYHFPLAKGIYCLAISFKVGLNAEFCRMLFTVLQQVHSHTDEARYVCLRLFEYLLEYLL